MTKKVEKNGNLWLFFENFMGKMHLIVYYSRGELTIAKNSITQLHYFMGVFKKFSSKNGQRQGITKKEKVWSTTQAVQFGGYVNFIKLYFLISMVLLRIPTAAQPMTGIDYRRIKISSQ